MPRVISQFAAGGLAALSLLSAVAFLLLAVSKVGSGVITLYILMVVLAAGSVSLAAESRRIWRHGSTGERRSGVTTSPS